MKYREKREKLLELLEILNEKSEGDRQLINDLYDVMITHAINAMSMRYGNPNMFEEKK